MVYFQKKFDDNQRIIYEYGRNENEFIGTIAFDVGELTNTDFSKRNLELKFYDGYAFCRLTASALQGISKFIREDNYPNKYLRATH